MTLSHNNCPMYIKSRATHITVTLVYVQPYLLSCKCHTTLSAPCPSSAHDVPLQYPYMLCTSLKNNTTRDTLARDSGEGYSGEERWVLNRLGGMAIVRVRSKRKEHGRTDGSSVLYTLQDTYCVRSTRCWFVETMRVSAPEHYWRAVEKDDTAANPC